MTMNPEVGKIALDDEDEGVIFMIAVWGILLSLPLLLVLFITTCAAYTRTREWQKEKARRSIASSEAETLMTREGDNSDSDSELDPTDSGDEAELRLREEKRRDLTLTSRQYFWKQMGRAWKGDQNAKDVLKAKEREERRKLAKAVARELVKMEKRRNRVVAERSGEKKMTKSPSYTMSDDRKKA